MDQVLGIVTYRVFILCVVNPRNGSTTNIVAKSSNSARSLKFIVSVPVFYKKRQKTCSHETKTSQKS